MRKILLDRIELGDSGELAKDKINSNNEMLNNVVSYLDDQTVKWTDVSSVLGVSANKIPSDQAVSKALADYAKKADVSIGMVNKGTVASVDMLPEAAASTRGDAYYVEGEGVIYQFDGTDWNRTIFTVFPSDVVSRQDLAEVGKRTFTGFFASTTELDNIKDTGIYKRVEGVMPMIVWVHKQGDGVTVTQLRIHIGNEVSIIETRKFSDGTWSSWKNDNEKWFNGSFTGFSELDNLKTGGYYIRKVANTNNAPTIVTVRTVTGGTVHQSCMTVEADGTSNYQTRTFDGTAWSAWVVNKMAFSGGSAKTLKQTEDELSQSIEDVRNNNAQFDFLETYFKPTGVNGWTITEVTNSYDTDIFGDGVHKASKLLLKEGAGRLRVCSYRIYTGNNLPHKAGDRLGTAFELYSPVDTTARFSLYTPGVPSEELVNIFYKLNVPLKKGVNRFSYTMIVPDVWGYLEMVVGVDVPVGTEMYIRNMISYLGAPKTLLVADPASGKVDKADGYDLVAKTEIEKLSKLSIIDAISTFSNLTDLDTAKFTPVNCAKTENEDGSLNFYKEVPQGDPFSNYVYFRHYMPVAWQKSHDYYVAIDMLPENADNQGDVIGLTVVPKYNDANTVGTRIDKQRVNKGERGIYKTLVSVDDSGKIDDFPTANMLFVQVNGRLSSGQTIDLTLYDILVVDLGERGTEQYTDYDTIDAYVSENGFVPQNIALNAKHAQNADNAKIAEVANSVKTIKVADDIEFWGDSLTGQNYSQYVAAATGREVTVRGYGGKTSTYIRDQFLALADTSKTQVIWVGRNNFGLPDVVIDDIRAMVEHLGHSRFIIMNPPNGNYAGEGKNDDNNRAYQAFMTLTDRLQWEYPANFLDIRRATINSYDMGGVTLLSSFVQPAVNGTVQINVSDANTLTTYNQADLTRWGADVMNKIRIGWMFAYNTDVYEVVSKDSDTLLTVRLVEANWKNPGEMVENQIDAGGNNAVKYMRVMQNADYKCFQEDRWLSTFRSDAIHMADIGKQEVAKHVVRKLEAMKI